MFSVLSSVLVATVALVPGAQAGLKASSHSGPKGSFTTKQPAYKKHTTKESSVKCHGTATAISYSDAADGFAYAMADAFKYGCSIGLDEDWKVMVDKMKDHDDAWAWAYAAASATVECESEGNAYGCAAAYANAKAWAKAVLVVWAEAWATAINSCHCKGKPNEAIVSEYGKAHEFEYLVAKVEAEASAYVCVSGDDHDFATAEAYCYQDIYAVGWAKAFAKALIDGECYDHYYGTGLEAEAKIEAKAKIDRWEYVDC